MFQEVPLIVWPGQINAWHDPNFLAEVEKTGREKLIMTAKPIVLG